MDSSEDASLAEIARSVAIKAKTRIGRMAQRGEPMWMKHHQKKLRLSQGDGTISLQTKKGMSARLELGKIVDGVYVHGIILTLIILDVICVICELTLAATICLDPNTSSSSGASGHRRRFLLSSTTSPSPMPQQSVQHDAFCTECMQIQLDVENVLHLMSVTILFVFLFQICLLVFAYGSDFFKNPFFMLDAVVVIVALVLEIGFHVREGALFVVLLSWRVVRIIHGFYTTVEIQHKETHKKIQHRIMYVHFLPKTNVVTNCC